jgi:hypothetical protein
MTTQPAGSRQGFGDALADEVLVFGQRPHIGRLRTGARESHGRSMAEDEDIPARGVRDPAS